ncbi:MAG: hypothetical protein ACRCYY_21215 [Trueperaceae bacterium]
MLEDIEKLKSNQWFQGSLIPLAMFLELQKEKRIPYDVEADKDILIVVGHDCDVNNHSFEKEPLVELLVARPVEKSDSTTFHAKTTRRLQFKLSLNDIEQTYECLNFERFCIDRRHLAKYSPQYTVDNELKHLIARWISNRYYRAAFPDAFNERISKVSKVREKIKSAFEGIGHYVTGVYIMLLPDQELNPGEDYKVFVQATIRTEDAENLEVIEQANAALLKFVSALNSCEGINIAEESYSVVSEEKFSLDDIRNSKRWDYDYLSFQNETDDEYPPQV